MRRTAERHGNGSAGGAAAGNDPALVARARKGDGSAYDLLYRRWRDSVARTAYLLMRDVETAQDVAQEAFLVGWRDLRRLRDPRLFRAWVTGIAVNLCRRHARGARWRPPAPLPEQRGDADLRMAVREALGRLPRAMRETVVLRFYGDFSEAEIATALAVPAGTVKSRLARARARLARSLRPIVEEEG